VQTGSMVGFSPVIKIIFIYTELC